MRIGSIPFVDGLTHDVYEDEGRQWVAAYDGERVYGVWLPPADEPMVVGGAVYETPAPGARR